MISSLKRNLFEIVGLFFTTIISSILISNAKWLGIGFIFSLLLLIISLINPFWIFVYAYPMFVWIGQTPIIIGEFVISFERLLILIGGLSIILAITINKIRIVNISKGLTIGFFLWLGMYIISFIVFPSNDGITEIFGFIQKGFMAYLVVLTLNTAQRLKIVTRLALASSFLLSFITLWAYFKEGSLYFIRQSNFAIAEPIQESLYRGLVNAGAGNTMAVWLAMIYLWQSKNYWQKILGFLMIIWLGIFSLFEVRREAIITITLGLTLLFLLSPKGRRRQIFLIGLLLLTILIIFIIQSPEWMDRLLLETRSQFESGTDARWMLLTKFTPHAMKDSLFIGHGPGNYRKIQYFYQKDIPPTALLSGGLAAHNVWSAAGVEAGIFALMGITIFLFYVGKPLFKKINKGDNDLNILWALAPILFYQILMNMFFGNDINLPETWFWIGYLVALQKVVQRMHSLGNNI